MWNTNFRDSSSHYNSLTALNPSTTASQQSPPPPPATTFSIKSMQFSLSAKSLIVTGKSISLLILLSKSLSSDKSS